MPITDPYNNVTTWDDNQYVGVGDTFDSWRKKTNGLSVLVISNSTATGAALALKANIASPTFTGTVSGITKSMVGLGNVTNTSDADKPVSTATGAALALKANIASPTFTGTASGTFSGPLTGNVTGSASSFTGSLSGDVTGTQGATVISASTVTSKAITGYVSGSGTLSSNDTILTAINKLNGNDALKAPLANPSFTGTVNSQGPVNASSVSVGDGSAGSPSITNNGDTDTGIYFSSDNAVSISCSGVETAFFIYNEQGGELQITDHAGSGNVLIDNFNGIGRLLKLGTGNLEVGTLGAGSLKLVQNNAAVVTLSGGNVGIGTASPATKLDVTGIVKASSFNSTSSLRYKQNIQPLTNALNIIEKLQGVKFDWKETGKSDIGLIAEQVNEVVPEFVLKDEKGLPNAIDYGKLTSILIEAVKELSALVKSQKS